MISTINIAHTKTSKRWDQYPKDEAQESHIGEGKTQCCVSAQKERTN